MAVILNILKFILCITIPDLLFAQTKTVTEGNLIHLTVDQNEIDLSDTLGNWMIVDEEGGSYEQSNSRYIGAFKINNKNYFIKLSTWSVTIGSGITYNVEDFNGLSLQVGYNTDMTPFVQLKYYIIENIIFFFQDINH